MPKKSKLEHMVLVKPLVCRVTKRAGATRENPMAEKMAKPRFQAVRIVGSWMGFLRAQSFRYFIESSRTPSRHKNVFSVLIIRYLLTLLEHCTCFVNEDKLCLYLCRHVLLSSCSINEVSKWLGPWAWILNWDPQMSTGTEPTPKGRLYRLWQELVYCPSSISNHL